MAKNFYDYRNEFNNILYKHGEGNVTPEIYQKEMLKYIKKMDPEFAFNNISKFINETANDVVTKSELRKQSLAQDKSMRPFHFCGNLLVKNIPSKAVLDIIESKMTKNAYINICEQVEKNEEVKKLKITEEANVENLVNRLKTLGQLRPTGNKFTKWFKSVFNIGGYNDKLAAYESCKRTVRSLIGDKLTNEQFETAITGLERYRYKAPVKEVAIINEFDIKEKDNQVQEQNEELVKGNELDKEEIIEFNN